MTSVDADLSLYADLSRSYIHYVIVLSNAGNAKKPILYHVDRTRDGSTYSSRAIKATQESIPIFTMQASFKLDETDPLEHQYSMPVVPGPEELVESYDFLQTQLE